MSEHQQRFDGLVHQPSDDQAFLELLGDLEQLAQPRRPTLEQQSTWEELERLLPSETVARVPDAGPLVDQIRGAWFGRVVGNMLGKPVENGKLWTAERLDVYLRGVDALPLVDYIPVDASEAHALGFLPNWTETTRGRVDGSSRDDDIDYTILNLHVLERYGRDFTTADVAATWLELIPFHQTYTAERAAYRNLVLGVPAEAAGGTANPYREWIGALIRADVFGMVCPGQPRRAAALAWKDAWLSHRDDGLYGEMWAAALVAAAFGAVDARSALDESVRHVPEHSRLAREVGVVMSDHAAGLSWDEAIARLGARHSGRNWVHVLNNVGTITAGLLWGDGDFSATIGLTVRGGLDTDSNAATAGAVAGILGGFDAIGSHWVTPLRGTLRSAIHGFDRSSIDELAERTTAIARLREPHTERVLAGEGS
ncbi:MAG: ADP-ribosylglycohydrolase family protein [Cellulomonadaceae bacterium]|nr:ADP-ribosylglycohydrolase family protein [Cellulomonadaceae bacterium]